MRLPSANAIKHNAMERLLVEPREGTQLRLIHDKLRASPAQLVDLHGLYASPSKLTNALERLRTYYGMDIRSFKDPARTYNSRNYMFVGEWVGKEYVDYVAQRINEEGL